MVSFIYHSPTDLVNGSEPIDLHYQKRQRIAQQSHFPCFHSYVSLFLFFFFYFTKVLADNFANHSHEFNVHYSKIRPQEYIIKWVLSSKIEMAIFYCPFFSSCDFVTMILASALELSSIRAS